MAKKQPEHDYDWIEPHWRANVKSLLQIAAEYQEATGRSISHTAISKHFKKLGIPRDLSKKVQDKARSMVSAAMVSGKVSMETTATDAEIINAEAMDVAAVLFRHRRDIPKKLELVSKLFQELAETTDGQGILQQVKEALCAADMNKLAQAVEKVVSIPCRIKGVQDLVNAYRQLLLLERQAVNADNNKNPDGESLDLHVSFVSPGDGDAEE